MPEVRAEDEGGKHLEGRVKNLFWIAVVVLGIVLLIEAVMLLIFL